MKVQSLRGALVDAERALAATPVHWSDRDLDVMFSAPSNRSSFIGTENIVTRGGRGYVKALCDWRYEHWGSQNICIYRERPYPSFCRCWNGGRRDVFTSDLLYVLGGSLCFLAILPGPISFVSHFLCLVHVRSSQVVVKVSEHIEKIVSRLVSQKSVIFLLMLSVPWMIGCHVLKTL